MYLSFLYTEGGLVPLDALQLDLVPLIERDYHVPAKFAVPDTGRERQPEGDLVANLLLDHSAVSPLARAIVENLLELNNKIMAQLCSSKSTSFVTFLACL